LFEIATLVQVLIDIEINFWLDVDLNICRVTIIIRVNIGYRETNVTIFFGQQMLPFIGLLVSFQTVLFTRFNLTICNYLLATSVTLLLR
jgi:hypothetical protein